MKLNNTDLCELAHEVELVSPHHLREHEQTYPDRRDEIVKQIKEMGFVDYPILVDNDFNVILDGHHRAMAMRTLGARRTPIIRVDYFDRSQIIVEPRPNCPIDPLTKQSILRMGLSDDVFPAKSTRHVLQFPEQRVDYPLDKLLP